MTNPIFAAIAPLKAAAQEKARETARAMLDRALADFEAAGWNLDVVAPRPNSHFDGKITYRTKLARNNFFSSIAVRDAEASNVAALAAGKIPGSMAAPNLYKRDAAREERIINNQVELAGQSFDMYVGKLVRKVGDCQAASVEGLLWTGSVLTVQKGEVTERWNTQQIINCSVYGKLFNQWPTRKIK